MAGNFHETYIATDDVEPPKPRATGIVFAVVALIVAVLFRNTWAVFVPALGLSAAFGLMAWLRPSLLGGLNRIWFQFSLLLHRIMSPVIMFLLFVLVITPYGLLMQLVRDPLQRRGKGRRGSYWVARDADERIDMTTQF